MDPLRRYHIGVAKLRSSKTETDNYFPFIAKPYDFYCSHCRLCVFGLVDSEYDEVMFFVL